MRRIALIVRRLSLADALACRYAQEEPNAECRYEHDWIYCWRDHIFAIQISNNRSLIGGGFFGENQFCRARDYGQAHGG